MLDIYADEIQQLEARAQSLRGAAEQIQAGIAKAEAQLRKIE